MTRETVANAVATRMSPPCVRMLPYAAMKRASMTALLLLLAVTSAHVAAQQPPTATPAPLLTDQVFRNIQVLKGIPVDTFFDVMGMFASSMGEDCTFCHSKQAVFDHKAFGDETPRIRRARQMIAMMNTINETNFGGRPMVTCFTCHRGSNSPVVSPKLALQYGEPEDDPNVINFPAETRPAATELLDQQLHGKGHVFGIRHRPQGNPRGRLREGAESAHVDHPHARRRQRARVRRQERLVGGTGRPRARDADE